MVPERRLWKGIQPSYEACKVCVYICVCVRERDLGFH